MAQQQAPDDIFALYCRFDLDVSQYHVFERGSAEFRQPSEAIDLTVAERTPDVIQAASEESPKAKATPTEIAPAGKREQSVNRSGLRNLLTNLNQLQERSVAAKLGPQCQPVTVFGSSGGVGVTTVMATLARQLAKQGSRCGLYEDATESVLPLFFGLQRIAAHHKRFAGLHSVLEPSVRLLGLDHTPSISDIHSEELSLQDRLFQSFGHELEFILADHSCRQPEAPNGPTIFVSLPDVPSLMNIRSFVSRTGWRPKNDNTICVLNRFDPGVALHRELLPWYEEQFAQVVTVGHSYLIPESLAEGTSVIDLAPESEVASDFVHLAARLRQVSATSSFGLSKRSEAKTQTEGLALCS